MLTELFSPEMVQEADIVTSPWDFVKSMPVDEDGTLFDMDHSPWVRVVFEWWLDPDVDWIYLLQGSQTTKTTTMMLLLLYEGKFNPTPAMWVGQKEDEVKDFVTDRLKPFLEVADDGSFTGKKRDWKTTILRLFGHMRVKFGWATSGKTLKGWPCEKVFVDEWAAFPDSLPGIGEPGAYIKKRTRKAREKRKGIFATTPSGDESPSWVTPSHAPFCHWHVPCPECGKFQYLSFRNLNFGHCKTKGGTWQLDKVLHETTYQCIECGSQLEESAKLGMVRQGRPHYFDLKTCNEYGQEPPKVRERSLQVPATYSLNTSWGQMARMFIEAKLEGPESLRIFSTDELAEPYLDQIGELEQSELAKCMDTRKEGEVPDKDVILTCGIDVQGDCCYYVVRAWSYGMETWLVTQGIVPRFNKSFDELDDIVLAEFDNYPITLTFMDSGYDTDLVYQYCRKHYPYVRPVKGWQNWKVPVSETAIETLHGKRIESGLHLFNINTAFFKSWVHNRIKADDEDLASWYLHSQVDQDYMDQVLNEKKIKVIKRGTKVEEWVMIKKAVGNHYFDCEVYATAAAWGLGIQRMKEGNQRLTQRSSLHHANGSEIKIRREYS